MRVKSSAFQDLISNQNTACDQSFGTGIKEEAWVERAKELFYKYHGNRFYMDHDGAGREYDSYHISKETEELWTKELISGVTGSKHQGKEALSVYSAAADMIKRDRMKDEWDELLYYPLSAGHLDDVTTLYMLSGSFKMAEKASKRDLFSKEEADTYMLKLERYVLTVRERSEEGTLTRAQEYIPQEFSDPVYVADYLQGLKKKWEELFR